MTLFIFPASLEAGSDSNDEDGLNKGRHLKQPDVLERLLSIKALMTLL